jgi:hypothetical protein
MVDPRSKTITVATMGSIKLIRESSDFFMTLPLFMWLTKFVTSIFVIFLTHQNFLHPNHCIPCFLTRAASNTAATKEITT